MIGAWGDQAGCLFCAARFFRPGITTIWSANGCRRSTASSISLSAAPRWPMSAGYVEIELRRRSDPVRRTQVAKNMARPFRPGAGTGAARQGALPDRDYGKGVVAALLEPVDADHQRPVSDTLAEAAHVSGAIRAGRLRGDRANIDTNREHLRSHCTPKGLPNTARKLLCSGPAHQIIAKAIEVLLRLEADQIVSAQ